MRAWVQAYVLVILIGYKAYPLNFFRIIEINISIENLKLKFK